MVVPITNQTIIITTILTAVIIIGLDPDHHADHEIVEVEEVDVIEIGIDGVGIVGQGVGVGNVEGAGHQEVEAAAGRMIDVIGIGGAGIAEVEAGVGVGNVAETAIGTDIVVIGTPVMIGVGLLMVMALLIIIGAAMIVIMALLLQVSLVAADPLLPVSMEISPRRTGVEEGEAGAEMMVKDPPACLF